MQLYTVYFICKLLYMFRVFSPPVVRNTNNSLYSIWYWSTVAATCLYCGGVQTTSLNSSTIQEDTLPRYRRTLLQVMGG